jgi:RimJ/RimL family protein N-acetyltransferase
MKATGKKPYSACVPVGLERPFWGAEARICAGEFFEFCALLGIRRLKAQCFERNRLARKLLKSAGFKCEGILKREAFVRGALENLVFYGKEV